MVRRAPSSLFLHVIQLACLGRSIHRTEEVAAHLDVRIHRLSAVETPTDHAGSVEFIS